MSSPVRWAFAFGMLRMVLAPYALESRSRPARAGTPCEGLEGVRAGVQAFAMYSVVRLGLAAAAIAGSASARATVVDPRPLEAEVGSLDDASAEVEGEARDVPVWPADASAPGAGPGLRELGLAFNAPPAPQPHLDLDLSVPYGSALERWDDPPALTPPAWLELKGLGALTAVAVVTMGVLAVLPEDISNWKAVEDPWATMQSNFERAWTQPPVWDQDGWGVNYVGHPLVGMYTYLSVRNLGANRGRSFLFSTIASVGWEYAVEAWAEQPSIQDLLVTSTVGSLLGEAVFQFTRYLLRGGLRGWEKVVLTIVNPVYVIEHGYR